MNLRRQPPQDSLDLLLDTMCNAFGGIILLAVMIALLARDVPRPSRGSAQDEQELTQRRLTRAKAEVERLQAELASLNARAASPALSERMELAREQARLQARLEALQAATRRQSSNAEPMAVDATARLAQLRHQMTEAQVKAAGASNAIAASNEDAERLRRRAADLAREVAETREESERQLRLPREHQTARLSFDIILRYGLVYPTISTDGEFERNTKTINWRPLAGGEKLVEPMPGAGLDPLRDEAALARMLGRLSKDRFYVAFHVHADSFEAFAVAKRMVLASGLEYGWRPYEADAKLTQSSSGQKVLAQ